MIIGGAMRFSQWDIDAKRARTMIKQSLTSLSGQVDHLWVYGNKLTDQEEDPGGVWGFAAI